VSVHAAAEKELEEEKKGREKRASGSDCGKRLKGCGGRGRRHFPNGYRLALTIFGLVAVSPERLENSCSFRITSTITPYPFFIHGAGMEFSV
jgi:hypothetical protein